MDPITRLYKELEIAAQFQAALLTRPEVLLEDKAILPINNFSKRVSVVDYALREARLLLHVVMDMPGNGDKK